MKHCITAIVIFVIFAYPINGQETCPTGKQSTKDCKNENCPSDSKCYRKDKKRFCCGDLDTFCPTKMHAFNSQDSGSYLWGPVQSTEPKWYNVALGTETIACPIPYSFAYSGYEDLKVLPVDYDATKPDNSKPKACKVNSECNTSNDEFCDTPTHPSYDRGVDRSGKDGSPLGFCYKFQNFGYTNAKPVINVNKKELTGCDNNAQCFKDGGAESFCLMRPGTDKVRIAANDGKVTYKSGFCANSHACDLSKHGSIVASLSKSNEFCKTNADCEGSSGEKKHLGLEPECISVSNIPDAKLCCFKHNIECEVGTVDHPLKKCSNFQSCNIGGNEAVPNKWCDDKSNHCCQDNENKLWACPDGATPLFNEPKCEGSSSSDIESGKCSKTGGICRHGHCCPALIRNNGNEFNIATEPYNTNVSCNSEEPILDRFNHAFCDRNGKNIVIMGTKTVNGDEIGEKGKNCTSNKECETEEVCVKRTNDDRYCVVNPLTKNSESSSFRWWYILIGLAVLVLLACFAGLVVIIYNSCCKKNKEKNKDTKPRTDKQDIKNNETSTPKKINESPAKVNASKESADKLMHQGSQVGSQEPISGGGQQGSQVGSQEHIPSGVQQRSQVGSQEPISGGAQQGSQVGSKETIITVQPGSEVGSQEPIPIEQKVDDRSPIRKMLDICCSRKKTTWIRTTNEERELDDTQRGFRLDDFPVKRDKKTAKKTLAEKLKVGWAKMWGNAAQSPPAENAAQSPSTENAVQSQAAANAAQSPSTENAVQSQAAANAAQSPQAENTAQPATSGKAGENSEVDVSMKFLRQG